MPALFVTMRRMKLVAVHAKACIQRLKRTYIKTTDKTFDISAKDISQMVGKQRKYTLAPLRLTVKKAARGILAADMIVVDQNMRNDWWRTRGTLTRDKIEYCHLNALAVFMCATQLQAAVELAEAPFTSAGGIQIACSKSTENGGLMAEAPADTSVDSLARVLEMTDSR